MDTGDFCNPMQQVPVLTTPIDSFDYNMCHKSRGICLILDCETFSPKSPATRSLENRTGSEVDSDKIKQLFGNLLGFEIYFYKDLTVAATITVLRQLAAYNHSEHDCFACFVLTHGDHGELYAYDGKYSIDLLFRNFLANNCPTLAGKPKLFFIQACQGNDLDDGVRVRHSRDSLDSVSYFKIPTFADFLIAYSTIPGYYSFRNTEKGAWFIRALVDVLQDYYLEYDLLTMMTMVCHRVAYKFTSVASTAALSQKKQVPCITSMLTRRVFLHPKSMEI